MAKPPAFLKIIKLLPHKAQKDIIKEVILDKFLEPTIKQYLVFVINNWDKPNFLVMEEKWFKRRNIGVGKKKQLRNLSKNFFLKKVIGYFTAQEHRYHLQIEYSYVESNLKLFSDTHYLTEIKKFFEGNFSYFTYNPNGNPVFWMASPHMWFKKLINQISSTIFSDTYSYKHLVKQGQGALRSQEYLLRTSMSISYYHSFFGPAPYLSLDIAKQYFKGFKKALKLLTPQYKNEYSSYSFIIMSTSLIGPLWWFNALDTVNKLIEVYLDLLDRILSIYASKPLSSILDLIYMVGYTVAFLPPFFSLHSERTERVLRQILELPHEMVYTNKKTHFLVESFRWAVGYASLDLAALAEEKMHNLLPADFPKNLNKVSKQSTMLKSLLLEDYDMLHGHIKEYRKGFTQIPPHSLFTLLTASLYELVLSYETKNIRKFHQAGERIYRICINKKVGLKFARLIRQIANHGFLYYKKSFWQDVLNRLKTIYADDPFISHIEKGFPLTAWIVSRYELINMDRAIKKSIQEKPTLANPTLIEQDCLSNHFKFKFNPTNQILSPLQRAIDDLLNLLK
ncbi:MAG: hypothetical protein GXO48_07080 [Chlorobi bacterium]|nr:hypothetical protein [Chlorobiota bacterium]